ncbi:hypothetical protein KSS87_019514 [Heliosperma pusillum]|nr:hypothetical protein KSS87_019514 [Heliosperma pusillum]
MMVEEGGDDRIRWGTWEELILGGAVLRYGSHDWDVIAKEVQSRTLFPSRFSPQVCKAKYEALQEHYSGSSAWFEELRKRRVEELRRALDMSDDSIGSLESKLVSLKVEKGGFNNASYSSSLASPVLFFRTGCNESSGKETSKDGSSAGSFTRETETTWSHQCLAGVVSEPSSSRPERFPRIDELAETMRSERGVSIKGRRGKRRRKDPREGSVGENNFLSSTDVMISEAREKLTRNSDHHAIEGTTGFKKRRKQLIKDVKEEIVEEKTLVSSGEIITISPNKKKVAKSGAGLPSRVIDAEHVNSCTSKNEVDDFTMILQSIMENEHASVFRRRLDSQKRARYRSIVRRHIDLDTIRSRIANKSIKSVVELFRDLLLIANNALIFYSRITREYKCALVLRDLVTKRLHQYYKEVGSKVISTQPPKSPVHKPPAKPRSARPFNRKPDNREAYNGGNNIIVAPKEGKHVSGFVGSPSSAESSALTQKSPGRRGKTGRVKRGNAGIQAETPMKVRKKAKDKLEKQLTIKKYSVPL